MSLQHLCLESVQLLIRRGADVDAVDDSGRSALIFAACSQHTETLHLLCTAGANVQLVDEDGQNALMEASQETFQRLVSCGCDPNAQDFAGRTALHHHSTADCKPTCVEALLQLGANSSIQDVTGATALHAAVFNEDIVRVLAAAATDINAADCDGNTALIYAMLVNHSWLVQTLLSHKADGSCRCAWYLASEMHVCK